MILSCKTLVYNSILHKESYKLVNNYDIIVFGELQIKNLVGGSLRSEVG